MRSSLCVGVGEVAVRIGLYVSHIGVPGEFRNNVSGHIQLPLQAARLLQAAGHEVHVITNTVGAGLDYPSILPDAVYLHEVVDSRVRSQHGEAQRAGVDPRRAVKQVREISGLIRQLNLDLLHVWGFGRTVDLGALLSLLHRNVPVVATLFSAPDRLSLHRRLAWKRLALFTLSTNFTTTFCRAMGLPADHIPHPAIRDLSSSGKPVQRNSVLYWRELTHLNGGDVARDSFARLATKRPDIDFVFAVRPWAHEVPGVDEVVRRVPNVHIHRFPYEPGVSLESLLASAICVVMPFRRLSIDPQLSIIESLQSGAPVIATNIRSNPEFVISGRTGTLVDVGDVDSTVRAIEAYLDDRDLAERQGSEARRMMIGLDWDAFTNRLIEAYQGLVT